MSTKLLDAIAEATNEDDLKSRARATLGRDLTHSKEGRIAFIRAEMADFKWPKPSANHVAELAEEWGVAPSTVEGYAAEATRRNRATTDPDELGLSLGYYGSRALRRADDAADAKATAMLLGPMIRLLELFEGPLIIDGKLNPKARTHLEGYASLVYQAADRAFEHVLTLAEGDIEHDPREQYQLMRDACVAVVQRGGTAGEFPEAGVLLSSGLVVGGTEEE